MRGFIFVFGLVCVLLSLRGDDAAAAAATRNATLGAFLPGGSTLNDTIASALEFAVLKFNSQSELVKIAVNITRFVSSASQAGDATRESCAATSSSLSSFSDRPAAIIDGTNGFTIPFAANNMSTLRIGISKVTAIGDDIPCLSLYPFFSSRQWARAVLDLVVSFGWRTATVATPGLKPFYDLISSDINSLSSSYNLTINTISFSSTDRATYATDAALHFGCRVVVLLGDSASAAQFINDVAVSVHGYQFQYIWVDPVEYSAGVSELVPLLVENGKLPVTGILTLSASPVAVQNAAELSLALGSPEILPEEAVIAYNSIMVLGSLLNGVVANDGDPYDAHQLLANLSSIAFNHTIGLFNITSTRSGVMLLSNCLLNTSVPTTHIFAEWTSQAGFQFFKDPNAIVWYDGTNTAPAERIRDYINIALAIPGERPQYMQWLYAAQIALEHVKQDGILPDLDIVLTHVNTSIIGRVAAERMSVAVEGSHFTAVVGGLFAEDTIPMQYVLNLYKIPHFGPIQTTTDLSDRSEFPYFVRMNSVTDQHTRALVGLWKALQWKNAAMTRGGSNDGLFGADSMREAVVDAKYSMTSRQPYVPSSIDSIFDSLALTKASGIRIVYAPAREAEMEIYLRVLKAGGYATKDWAFYLSDRSYYVNLVPNGTANLFTGLQALGVFAGEGAQYERLMADFKALDPVTYPQSFAAINHTTVGLAYVYDSIITIARAAQKMLASGQRPGPDNGPALYRVIMNSTFAGATGTLSFVNGTRKNNTISFVNYVDNEWVEFARAWSSIGKTKAESVLILHEPVWIQNGTRPVDLVGTIVQWSDAAGIVIVIITIIMMIACLVVIALVITHRRNKLIYASSPPFLIFVLIGILFAHASVIASTGNQSTASCTLRVWLFIIGFAMAYGGLMIKNWRIYRMWSEISMRVVHISNTDLMVYSLFYMVPFLSVLIFWTIFDQPTAVLFKNVQGCSYGVSPGAYSVCFILICIMLILGCVLAILTRNVPQLYNECRYIAISTYALAFFVLLGLVIHILLAPVSVLASYLVYSGSVLFGFGAVFFALFVPKLWILKKLDISSFPQVPTTSSKPSRHKEHGSGANTSMENNFQGTVHSITMTTIPTVLTTNSGHTIKLPESTISSEDSENSDEDVAEQDIRGNNHGWNSSALPNDADSSLSAELRKEEKPVKRHTKRRSAQEQENKPVESNKKKKSRKAQQSTGPKHDLSSS